MAELAFESGQLIASHAFSNHPICGFFHAWIARIAFRSYSEGFFLGPFIRAVDFRFDTSALRPNRYWNRELAFLFSCDLYTKNPTGACIGLRNCCVLSSFLVPLIEKSEDSRVRPPTTNVQSSTAVLAPRIGDKTVGWSDMLALISHTWQRMTATCPEHPLPTPRRKSACHR